MYQSVLTTLKAHQSILDGSPALANGTERLEERIESLKALMYSQSIDTRWISSKKSEMTDKMLSKAFALNKVLLAYAKANDHMELFNHFNITATHYMTGGVHAKISRVNELIAILPQHLSGLLPYNVTAESIDELSALRDELEDYIQSPRIARAQRSLLTQQVAETKKKIDSLLKFEIDGIVLLLKESEPEFYSHYKIVRRVDQNVTRHRSGGNFSADPETGNGFE